MRLRTPRHRFQSTPSARRATNSTSASCTAFCNFNPRPPRGERPPPFFTQLPNGQFQSTPSARRATSVSSNPFAVASISIHALREESDVFHVAVYKDLGISIHALREESDQEEKQCHTEGLYFNPRPPRGERRPRPRPAALSAKFQSTPSARRATAVSVDRDRISLTFQSTPSARRATGFGHLVVYY